MSFTKIGRPVSHLPHVDMHRVIWDCLFLRHRELVLGRETLLDEKVTHLRVLRSEDKPLLLVPADNLEELVHGRHYLPQILLDCLKVRFRNFLHEPGDLGVEKGGNCLEIVFGEGHRSGFILCARWGPVQRASLLLLR